MLTDSIRATAAAALRDTKCFEAARARHVALAPYDRAAALLAALRAPLADADPAEREAVVVALLIEHRASASPLWQALLLAAFEPLLVRMRVRLGHRGDEDLDQRILLGFFEALATVRTDRVAVLGIRWAVLDVVKTIIRDERREPETIPFDEEHHASDAIDAAPATRIELAEIARLVAARGGDALVDALFATNAGESLADYVRRTYGDAGEKARACAYGRLHRARQEVLAAVRRAA